MEAGDDIEVLNPYDWLPGYGESGLTLSRQGSDLIVVIDYESASGEARKELRFKGVCSYSEDSFPGPELPRSIIYRNKLAAPLHSLVEYPNSEVAAAWAKHFGHGRVVKHYRIIFLAENKFLVVFARNVELSDIKK